MTIMPWISCVHSGMTSQKLQFCSNGELALHVKQNIFSHIMHLINDLTAELEASRRGVAE